MKWTYKSNNKYFTNKFSVIDEFESTKKGLELVTPEEYNNFDFSNEPAQNMTSLLKSEAVKLREQNNYLRLFYSGGADSQVVLDAFINNDVLLDEIVCFKSGFTEADFEIDNFALPYLNRNKDKLSQTKIKILIPTMEDYHKWYHDDWTSKYFLHQFTSTVAFFRLMDQPYDFNDGAVNIKGKDKPKIVRHKGKLYTYISDSNSEIEHNIYHFMLENPAILSKQCHLLLKGLSNDAIKLQKIYESNSLNDESNKIIHSQIETPVPPKQKIWSYAKMENTDREMYYMNEKERLALLEASKMCPEALDRWIAGINKIRSSRFKHWFNNGRPEFGTTGIQSKFFCLTENNVATIDELYPNGFTKENIIAMAKMSAK